MKQSETPLPSRHGARAYVKLSILRHSTQNNEVKLLGHEAEYAGETGPL